MPGYMQNPVILASHQHKLSNGKSSVVGKVVSYRFDKQNLIVTIEFAETDLATEYWNLYRDKFQRALSIGFHILKSPREEIIDGQRVRVFDSIELLEISCVAIPANREALSKNFVQKKRIEREKHRILDDVDALLDLFDRYDDVRFDIDRMGQVPADHPVWKSFSAAEKEILLDFHKDDLDWGFDEEEIGCCAFHDSDGLGGPLDDDSKDPDARSQEKFSLLLRNRSEDRDEIDKIMSVLSSEQQAWVRKMWRNPAQVEKYLSELYPPPVAAAEDYSRFLS
jgi:HK97 family phage prohead protease